MVKNECKLWCKYRKYNENTHARGFEILSDDSTGMRHITTFRSTTDRI